MKKQYDLGKDNITHLIRAFVIPAVLAMVATNTAALVDSYFLGNYVGAKAIAGLTLITPFINIIIGVVIMIVAGGVVLCGEALGADRMQTANRHFNTTLMLTLVCGLATSIILYFATGFIATHILNIDGVVAQYVVEYFSTFAIFIIALMLMNFFSYFLKLAGMPNLVVWLTVLSVVINIVLDYLLVGQYQMGMHGAALATGLSQVIPVIIFIVVTIKYSPFSFKLTTPVASDVGMIFFNGSSELIGMSALAISAYLYNVIIMHYMGIVGVSAFGIALEIGTLATMIFYGVADGITSLISFNYGAKQLDRVEQIRNISLTIIAVIGVVLTAILWFFNQSIAGLFVKDSTVIQLGAHILRFYAIATVMMGINIIATTYYTAILQPVKSIVIALARSFVGVVAALIILPLILGESGLWLPIIAAEVLAIAVTMYYFRYYPFGELGAA